MFELGDRVQFLDDGRVATILAVLKDPFYGGNFEVLKEASLFTLGNVPMYSIAGKQFTDDNGNYTNEPVYFLQGQDWFAYAVTHEIKLEKPKQLGLL